MEVPKPNVVTAIQPENSNIDVGSKTKLNLYRQKLFPSKRNNKKNKHFSNNVIKKQKCRDQLNRYDHLLKKDLQKYHQRIRKKMQENGTDTCNSLDQLTVLSLPMGGDKNTIKKHSTDFNASQETLTHTSNNNIFQKRILLQDTSKTNNTPKIYDAIKLKNDITNVAILQMNEAMYCDDQRKSTKLKSGSSSEEHSSTSLTSTLKALSYVKSPLQINQKTSFSNSESLSIGSDETLTNLIKPLPTSSDDTTYIIDEPKYLLKNKNNTDYLLNTRNVCAVTHCKLCKPSSMKYFMNTGANLNSSNENYKNSSSDIFISKHPTQELLLKNKGDDVVHSDKLHENIITKAFKTRDNENVNKITVPNEKYFEDIIIEAEKSQKKSCSEEYRCLTSFTELWDKLNIFLELSIKKMEDTLTEKIVCELRKTLNTFEKYAHDISTARINYIKSKVKLDPNMLINQEQSNNVDNITELSRYLNQYIQCNLVKNQFIDEGSLKLNIEEDKNEMGCSSSNGLSKFNKQNLLGEYFQIIKPFNVTKMKNKEPTLSSSEEYKIEGYITDKTKGDIKSKFAILNAPLRFVRANAFVISGVPVFCISLILIYGCIMLLIKVLQF